MTANTHPDHDTIAAFQRHNRAAFEAAFVDILLMARQTGLWSTGTVSVDGTKIDGTKIDANASKVCSVRYDRAQTLRAKLAACAQMEADARAAAQAAQPAYTAKKAGQEAKTGRRGRPPKPPDDAPPER